MISLTGGLDSTNQGNFHYIIEQHIYDNTAKVPKVVEPDEPVKPIDEQPVDLKGIVMFGDFSAGLINGETTNGKGFEACLKKDALTDSDKDGLSDSDEVDWINLNYNGITNVYSCKTILEWNKILQQKGIPLLLKSLKVKILTIVSNPLKPDSDDDRIADGPKDVLGNGKINDKRKLRADYFLSALYEVPSIIKQAIEYSGFLDDHSSYQKTMI